jgi:hypothetical protein
LKNLTNIQKIIGLLVIIVVLILATNLIRSINSTNKNGISYKNTSAEQLISKSTRNYDRVIFYELEEIAAKFVGSYKVSPDASQDEKKDFVSYDKYSNALDTEYKNYLGLGYNKKAEEFLKNFVVNTQEAPQMDTVDIVKEVYTINTNKYLCVMKSDNSDKKLYLGITLIPETNNWNIFYIE